MQFCTHLCPARCASRKNAGCPLATAHCRRLDQASQHPTGPKSPGLGETGPGLAETPGRTTFPSVPQEGAGGSGRRLLTALSTMATVLSRALKLPGEGLRPRPAGRERGAGPGWAGAGRGQPRPGPVLLLLPAAVGKGPGLRALRGPPAGLGLAAGGVGLQAASQGSARGPPAGFTPKRQRAGVGYVLLSVARWVFGVCLAPLRSSWPEMLSEMKGYGNTRDYCAGSQIFQR